MTDRQRFLVAVFDLALTAEHNRTEEAIVTACHVAECDRLELTRAVLQAFDEVAAGNAGQRAG